MTDNRSHLPSSDERAQQAADRLALALEEAGFDVGLEFPRLRIGWDNSGSPGVHLGAVTSAVASELALLLGDAAAVGVKIQAR